MHDPPLSKKVVGWGVVGGTERNPATNMMGSGGVQEGHLSSFKSTLLVGGDPGRGAIV